jgi:hypothetical protein
MLVENAIRGSPILQNQIRGTRSNSKEKFMNPARKVVFHLTPDEDGYPPADSEGMWARPLSNGNLKIDNIPFYAIGISSDDEISADEVNGELRFKKLIRPSGNSTFRIMLTDPSRIEPTRAHLRKLGCQSEFNQIVGLLAVEVPENVDIHPFLAFIVDAKARDELDYEEAALRHSL